ncbi:hypothetical protein VPH35_101507 [Triticum aestivum]
MATDHADFISNLPDKVLGTIVSLLPTKEGCHTQTACRRWRSVWRSAPLNLNVHIPENTISHILSRHLGPVRSISITIKPLSYCYRHDDAGDARVDGWFCSRGRAYLQELRLVYNSNSNGSDVLPPSVFRRAPMLRVARFGRCRLPPYPAVDFPLLQQLIIRLDAYTRFLKVQELIIDDAPCLVRLLPLNYGPATIRVIQAPKLEVLGPLSKGISELHLGRTVFQKMIAISLRTTIHTVKVLALDHVRPHLHVVLDILKCFPCWGIMSGPLPQISLLLDPLEKIKTGSNYASLANPVECLEHHPKKVALKFYQGNPLQVDFARFIIMNAKVLEIMEFGLVEKSFNGCDKDKWRYLRHKSESPRPSAFTCSPGVGDHTAHMATDRPDLISKLPDAWLGAVVSLLPAKDGCRTQALSRRWRHTWRSVPLNLDDSIPEKTVSGVLSGHLGPISRLCFTKIAHRQYRYHHRTGHQIIDKNGDPRLDDWFRARGIAYVEELQLVYSYRSYGSDVLPLSVFRCAPALRVATFGCCRLPPNLAEMIAVSLTTTMHTVKVLALQHVGPDLDAVIGLLKCFPCLQSLYIVLDYSWRLPHGLHKSELYPAENINNASLDDPVECLEHHLKKMAMKVYYGKGPEIDFARFFVLNAKVLDRMEFGIVEKSIFGSNKEEWMTNQYKQLRVEDRASHDARFAFKRFSWNTWNYNNRIHDLSMADPFDASSLDGYLAL